MPDGFTFAELHKHPLYDKYRVMWDKMDKVIEGQEAVHEAGTTFLPRLTQQTDEEYRLYKERALFYEATGRTLDALAGQLFVKAPSITNVDDRWYEEQGITLTELSLRLKNISRQILTKGFVGVLVDVDEYSSGSSLAYFCKYDAQDILDYSIRNDKITYVLLHEVTSYPGALGEPYRTSKVIRKLYLSTEGSYLQDVYVMDTKTEKYEYVYTITPSKAGRPLTEIPFVIITSYGVNVDPVRGPLFPIMNANVSHYRTYADLEHGRHFTALPTAWVAGFTPDAEGSLRIGATTAWVSSNPAAKAGFLEFTGAGLGSLEKALDVKEKQMANLGGQFLIAASEKVQSGVAHSIKRSGENSALGDIADTLSSGMTRVLRYLSDWNGRGMDASLYINKDYSVVEADPNLLNTLFALLQSGQISTKSFHYNLLRMGVLPETNTYEQEQEQIEEDTESQLTRMSQSMPEDEDEEDEDE